MNKILTSSILAGLMLCACQKEELRIDNEPQAPEQETFTAIIEDNDDSAVTRTSLDEKGNVLWKSGDEVSLFAGTASNGRYKVSEDSAGKTSATLNPAESSESGTGSGAEIGNNVAYYPYTATATVEAGEDSYVIKGISLPATQAYAENSFDNGASPMAAVTSSTADKNLKFRNVLGGLKLQLKGNSKVKSISVRGNADEILCGSGSVTVSGAEVPSISLTDATATTVTLDCGTEGVQLDPSTATCFIISLPPMTMASGFTVTVRDTDGNMMEINSTKSQTINRSRLLKMPSVDYVGTEDYTQQPLTFTSTGATVISITKEESPADIKLEYKKAGEGWTEYTIGKEISLSDGAELQFRAGEVKNSTFSSSDGAYKFAMSGDGTVKVSGNIMSLLDNTMSRTDVPKYCFGELFSYCGKLTDAADLKLPATTLAEGCYSAMFLGCTSLTTAPDLPATDLAVGCYNAMFCYCGNLKSAPALEATKLFDQCYSYMFEYCTNLTAAPDLPATDLADYCYYGMFSGCSSLESAPKLEATKLFDQCYSHMFEYCTNLTAAPDLPATDLADYCYQSMFDGCTALTAAPKSLRAEELTAYCYSGMFKGCTKLETAPELWATTVANYCCEEMFSGCSALTTAPVLSATTLSTGCYKNMFQGCKTLKVAPNLPAKALANYCYSYMFEGCTSLIGTPSELPATTLAEFCYECMFQGCSDLTAAPALPAEEMKALCYSSMFADCSSLKTAPELKAKKLARCCYQSMFQGCTDLTAVPTSLPAEELTANCYSKMFKGCSNLIQAPVLPATTLADNCYTEMFSGCSKLTTAPELPATKMSKECYAKMFQNCTSLMTAPVLPATALTSNCYWGMFSGCSSLNYIKALFTNKPSEALTDDWVSGVAQEGTFVMNKTVTHWKADDVRGEDGIPANWTVTAE